MIPRHVISALIGLEVGKVSHYFDERELTCGVVTLPFIVRLDGVKFGNRLTGFEWPRDERVHRALVEAGLELMRQLGADMCYIVSDEINLVFLKYLPYGGRVFKIISVSAGIASSVVSLKLGRELYFDSRVVKVESLQDVRTYILYRARVGLNNYLGSIAAARKMFRKGYTPTIDELVCCLRAELEKPSWKYVGTLLIRKKVSKKAVDKLTGREVEVRRSIISEESIEILIEKPIEQLVEID